MPSAAVNNMSVPSALPTLPPLDCDFKAMSVVEISTGKLVRLVDPDTCVWLMVIAFRYAHDVSYQAAPDDAIVYVDDVTLLFGIPAAYAMARIVVVAFTVIAPLYTVPLVVVGRLPSVVYRIAAPDVLVLRVTVCALLYKPPVGLKVGVAAAPPFMPCPAPIVRNVEGL